VVGPPPPPAADLEIQKTHSPDPVNVGGQLTYTLSARNNGPSPATQVVITDSLPASVTYVSSTSTQGTCSASGQVVTCAVGTMPVGATVTVTIVVRPLQPGTITNVASIAGAEFDPSTAGNRDEDPALVVAPPVVCPILTLVTRTVPVGKRSTIRGVVTVAGKRVAGVRVLARGHGIIKSDVSNSRGVVRIAVKPSKVGVITLRVVGHPGCAATKRVGVAGVFKPPLTG
jgi:uncharacterized repeat protein (TIGR01451 family)